jgi:hypothetical protein
LISQVLERTSQLKGGRAPHNMNVRLIYEIANLDAEPYEDVFRRRSRTPLFVTRSSLAN